MDQRKHHLCHLTLDTTTHLVVWYTGNPDGFLVSPKQKLLCFKDAEDARQFAKSQGLVFLKEAPALYDFDRIAQWLPQANPAQINCPAFLNAWNFFTDLAASTNSTTLNDTGPELNTIYDKIFRGNNLPSITPEGKHYEPAWSPEEARSLARLFANGINLLRTALP